MASITGKVGANKAYDADAAVTAWEAKPNILSAKKIGVPGANVADEISNGIAGLRITSVDAAVSTWAAQVDADAAYALQLDGTANVNHDFAGDVNLDFRFTVDHDYTFDVERALMSIPMGDE